MFVSGLVYYPIVTILTVEGLGQCLHCCHLGYVDPQGHGIHGRGVRTAIVNLVATRSIMVVPKL